MTSVRFRLKPAAELARANTDAPFPTRAPNIAAPASNCSAEEIELRRHIERVAELRRALPPGGEVTKNYAFEGEGGKATLADLFGNKQTLVIYSYMFGPQRETAVPDVHLVHEHVGSETARRRAAHRVRVRGALADRAVDRGEEGARLDAAQDLFGSIGRLHARLRQLRRMPMRPATTCSRAATAPSAISGPARWDRATADPGQDPRGAPDLDPLWTILDTTPEGRGKDWYPRLSY